MGGEGSEEAEDMGSDRKQEPFNWPVAVSVSFFGIQTIAQLAVTTKLLIRVWPGDGTLRGDVDQLVFVLVAGSFGGAVGVLADYSRCIFRLFKPTDPYLLNMAVKGFWMFLVRVCLGAGAALAFYLAIRAGLIALGETRLDSGFNPWGTAGLSAIAGMFGGLVIERLWSTAQSLIGRPPA